jgi:hypothetical protein
MSNYRNIDKDFFDLAAEVYKDYPGYIPENQTQVMSLLDDCHPFYRSGGKKLVIFNSSVRIVGWLHSNMIIDEQPVAYFGLWESHNDFKQNLTAFQQLEKWARQNSAKKLYGPIDMNTFNKYRIRINPYSHAPAFIGEPFNPDYYEDLLVELGFICEDRYVTLDFPSFDLLERESMIKQKKQTSFSKTEITIRSLSPEFWTSHLRELYSLVEFTFGSNFGYSKISYGEFKNLCGDSFSRKFCPHMSMVVLDNQGVIQGFLLSYPDYGSLINMGIPENKRLSQEDINFSDHFHLIKDPTVLIKTIGVTPKYRNHGLYNAMIIRAISIYQKYYIRALGCLIKEDNFSLSFINAASEIRNYGLFSKSLDM